MSSITYSRIFRACPRYCGFTLASSLLKKENHCPQWDSNPGTLPESIGWVMFSLMTRYLLLHNARTLAHWLLAYVDGSSI